MTRASRPYASAIRSGDRLGDGGKLMDARSGAPVPFSKGLQVFVDEPIPARAGPVEVQVGPGVTHGGKSVGHMTGNVPAARTVRHSITERHDDVVRIAGRTARPRTA
jgi:hypothetical protein